jgi:hypothetical protein
MQKKTWLSPACPALCLAHSLEEPVLLCGLWGRDVTWTDTMGTGHRHSLVSNAELVMDFYPDPSAHLKPLSFPL